MSIYQETLKAKTKQLKALASEVNMYESQIDEYKYEIDKLNRQLTEVRQKYFFQKKKEAMAKEKERISQMQQLTTTINGITLQQPPPDLIQPNRSRLDSKTVSNYLKIPFDLLFIFSAINRVLQGVASISNPFRNLLVSVLSLFYELLTYTKFKFLFSIYTFQLSK